MTYPKASCDTMIQWRIHVTQITNCRSRLIALLHIFESAVMPWRCDAVTSWRTYLRNVLLDGGPTFDDEYPLVGVEGRRLDVELLQLCATSSSFLTSSLTLRANKIERLSRQISSSVYPRQAFPALVRSVISNKSKSNRALSPTRWHYQSQV